MPDLSTQLLPRLIEPRFKELNLPPGFVYPEYQGYSLANLPETICAWLGAPGLGGIPLGEEYRDAIGLGGIRRVVFFLLDGVGLQLLQSILAEEPASPWRQLLPGAVFGPLTSVVPSTTAAALTSLWTGRAPAGHGVLGYEMWLKEYGLIANMILQTVAAFGSDPSGLKRAGFQPELFLHLPTLGSHFHKEQIRSYAFMNRVIARSGLSTMHFPGVKVTGYHGLADLFVSLENCLDETRGERSERSYLYAYWETIDELSHAYGPMDRRIRMELDIFGDLLVHELLPFLARQRADDTLILISADHGLVHTPVQASFDLRNHPHLARMLPMPPSGDHRFAYLYVRPGKTEAVAAYIEEHWPDQFCLVPAADALSAGLFGLDPIPQAEERIGDLILIAREERAYLWWADRENTLLGRHGGLSWQEMLVPFFALRP